VRPMSSFPPPPALSKAWPSVASDGDLEDVVLQIAEEELEEVTVLQAPAEPESNSWERPPPRHRRGATPLAPAPLPLEALPPLPQAPAASLAPDSDDSERRRIVDHLAAIGRLPPNFGALETPVLRSIQALYALLPSATDDIQRKSVIRQAFATEAQLRSGLLGLIALMDASVDTGDPVIRSAKLEPLIKILLFEEQRRKELGAAPASVRPSGIAVSSHSTGTYPRSAFGAQNRSGQPLSTGVETGRIGRRPAPPPLPHGYRLE
jgi:hypothetical protein